MTERNLSYYICPFCHNHLYKEFGYSCHECMIEIAIDPNKDNVLYWRRELTINNKTLLVIVENDTSRFRIIEPVYVGFDREDCYFKTIYDSDNITILTPQNVESVVERLLNLKAFH